MYMYYMLRSYPQSRGRPGWNKSAIRGESEEFKAGKTPIMLATDVAARGLELCTLIWMLVRCARSGLWS
ncbi:hypothetical protein NECAME_15288 [Necator americanus]|uniref:Helicase C-terminal domain-containing protein n=1 Tax=Necator americanus TaxID=51031 RepID=W2SIS1_NECAM|nr:hypothetical protein NECAME_15288 [Necator americanus]ETN69468.1 hypothetical protein NECAME_15288 [Necator americanus]